MAIDSQHEIQAGRLSRDTRSAWTRFMVSLHRPNNFKLTMLALIGLMVYQPAAWPVWILIMCMMVMSFNDQRFRMPLRMPKDIGGKDRTDYYEELVEQKTLWGLFKSSPDVSQASCCWWHHVPGVFAYAKRRGHCKE